MTDEQMDELMAVAVNMQRDAETDCNRPSAMFAYAVQVAIQELRNVRNIIPSHEDHVAAMNTINAITKILGSSDVLGISGQVAELKAQVEKLDAENAGLRTFITTDCHVAHAAGGYGKTKKVDRCDVCTEGARGGCGTCVFNGNF